MTDERLVASVWIAADPADDRLVGEEEPEDDGAFDDDDDLVELPDFVTIPVDFERGTDLN